MNRKICKRTGKTMLRKCMPHREYSGGIVSYWVYEDRDRKQSRSTRDDRTLRVDYGLSRVDDGILPIAPNE